MSKEICGECHNRPECPMRSDSAFILPGHVVECGQFKPMTNADHIRAMSDKELCRFFDAFSVCDTRSTEECQGVFIADCTACMMDWLKQPYGGT